MTISELLTKFGNPEIIQSLSMSDKMLAGLVTVCLGMGITFSALIILQFIISWMDKLLNRSTKNTEPPLNAPHITTPETQPQTIQNDTELIAVISSVIAMQMATTVDNIVIRNISKIESSAPVWSRAGITDQMNNRL
jgi:sodium pump decarboxylase gamma subunit